MPDQDKLKLRVVVLSISNIIRWILDAVLLFYAWHEAGFFTSLLLTLQMIAIEAIGISIQMILHVFKHLSVSAYMDQFNQLMRFKDRE